MADPFRPSGSTAHMPKPKKHKGAAKRGSKGKKAHGLPQRTMGGYRREITPPGQDAQRIWAKANPRQRQALRHMARRRGVTLQSLLGGGPRALQLRSESGIRKQALRTIRAGYKPAEQELNTDEQKAKAIAEAQESAEVQFQNWLAGQHAQQHANAVQADAAARTEMARMRAEADARMAAAQQQAAGEGQSPGSYGADQYQQQQIANAREAAAGTGAAQDSRLLQAQAAGQGVETALRDSTIATGQQQRAKVRSDFNERMSAIADERKNLRLRKAADIEKLIVDLQDRNIKVGQSNRDFQAVMQELGIKGYEARVDAKDKARDARLKRRDQNLKLRQNEIENKLKMIDQQLKARDISRKERADLLAHRDRLLAEQGRNRRALKGGGGGGTDAGGNVIPDSEGARNRWALIEEGVSGGVRPKSHLLNQAIGQIKRYGSLRRDTYLALLNANVYVPKRYRVKPPNAGLGPH